MIKLAATTKAGGVFFAMPDVCLTPTPPGPPIPIPYPNTAQVAAADGCVDKVLVEMKECVAEGSKIPNTAGDEAGTQGGIMSGVNMKEAQPRQFSSKVVVGGKKIVHHTATTAHNGTNANAPAGCHVAPSQSKVLVGV